MFVNQTIFEDGRRHQQITSYAIYPRQSSEQEDYQILAENVPSTFKDDLRIIQNKEKIDFWIEEKAKAWCKLSKLLVNTPQQLFVLSGNPSAKCESNGDNAFEFFDGFDKKLNYKYLTGWVKSGSNPLKDIGTSQGWFAAVYNAYDSKFYLFVQRDDSPSANIECWSFSKANAETPANWTDEGVVYTASQTWEGTHIEPHGIIWETQAMADAREGVGAGEGTRKWRLYYCGNGGGGYDSGFITASESNMTSWAHYSGNPVYSHDASYTYPDCKTTIYNNEVWMLIGRYIGTNPQNCFFTHSANGIDSWTDVGINYDSDWLLGTLHVLNGGINTYKANDATMEAGFSIDGTSNREYSGNPTLTGTETWEDVIGWLSVTQTKDGSCLIDGDYYLWYLGVTSGVHKLCLAKTQTVTNEGELDTDKWEVAAGTSAIVSNGILTLDGGIVDNRGIYTKIYNHPTSGVIIDYKGKAGITTGWAEAVGSFKYSSAWHKGAGGIGDYNPPKRLKVWNYAGTAATNDHDYDGNTWYDITTILKPAEIEIKALGTTVSIANTLEAHAVSVYAYKDRYLQKFRIRKYASPEPLILKRRIGGKADVIKAIVSGIVA